MNSNEELLREDECSFSDCVEPSGHTHDQDGTTIEQGHIIIDARGRCYLVVETPPTILAQGVVSGRRRNRMGLLPAEYVRAYHTFIIPGCVNVEDGKLLHRQRLAVDSAARREKMRLRHTSTDKLLRDRGIRG